MGLVNVKLILIRSVQLFRYYSLTLNKTLLDIDSICFQNETEIGC